MKKFAENMLDFIYESPTQFNAVAVSWKNKKLIKKIKQTKNKNWDVK